MIDRWQLMFPAQAGPEPRCVSVYLPGDYTRSAASYPVLYLFDGQNAFTGDPGFYGASWQLEQLLDRAGARLIVVAAASSADLDTARMEEYAPFSYTHKFFGTHTGRGQATMDWYVHTLKPAVDARYRTRPGRADTCILGCSLGGLMSLYALLACNDTFHGAAALSPSLWAGTGELRQLIRTAPLDADTVLYLDYGQVEYKQHKGMDHLLPDFGRALLARHVLLTQRLVPGGTHSGESWLSRLPFALAALYGESWLCPGAADSCEKCENMPPMH